MLTAYIHGEMIFRNDFKSTITSHNQPIHPQVLACCKSRSFLRLDSRNLEHIKQGRPQLERDRKNSSTNFGALQVKVLAEVEWPELQTCINRSQAKRIFNVNPFCCSLNWLGFWFGSVSHEVQGLELRIRTWLWIDDSNSSLTFKMLKLQLNLMNLTWAAESGKIS